MLTLTTHAITNGMAIMDTETMAAEMADIMAAEMPCAKTMVAEMADTRITVMEIVEMADTKIMVMEIMETADMATKGTVKNTN